MYPLRRKFLIGIYKLSDLLILSLVGVISKALLLYSTGQLALDQFLAIGATSKHALLIVSSLFLWHATFSSLGLYESKRFSSPESEVKDILKATSLGTLFIFVLITLTLPEFALPVLLFTFWVASSSITVGVRKLMRSLLTRLRIKGRNLRHILIIGTNPRARLLAEKIQARPEMGYHLLDFMDPPWPGLPMPARDDRTAPADLDGFSDFLRQQVIDEVVICLPLKTFYDKAQEIIQLCEEQGVIVRVLADLFELKLGRVRFEQFEGLSLLTVYTGTIENWKTLVKRMMDVTFSLGLIILLSPLLLLVALALKLSSPGPILFTQDRVGYNKRRFLLYKFRTMVQDAEKLQAELETLNEAAGPVFKIKNDPRITRLGKFLRKTSLDELPQLFNVVKGDMSLVGPRPLPLRDYEGFDKDWQRRRFSVRPGITCLWQVSGRTGISFDEWMQLDIQYIDQWSLWLDIKILAKTIPAVLRGEGAY
jgi:exopolysaccharide biosynthesis polyprenyl glycosylphosphotransferase